MIWLMGTESPGYQCEEEEENMECIIIIVKIIILMMKVPGIYYSASYSVDEN